MRVGHLTLRGPALVLLGACAFVVLYITLVPPSEWVGLFPSPLPSGASAPPHGHVASLAEILADVHANVTAVWARTTGGSPPTPIYGDAGSEGGRGATLTRAQMSRYAHLRSPPLSRASRIHAGHGDAVVPKYLFATLTRNIADQLPDLLQALAVVVHFVGPEHVSFAILEGPSRDATPQILEEVLRPMLRALGVADRNVWIQTDSPKVDWYSVNRIEKLAELRNAALAPLWQDNDRQYLASTHPDRRRTVGTDVAAVVFFNDVYLHAADVLELLHQHVTAGKEPPTGITAAWDWYSADPAHFYDVWVARTIDTGDLFYPINWEWWAPSDDILAASPRSRLAYNELRPFQAYSAWNGIAVLSPTPFLPPFKVRFRRGAPGECAASECTLLAADFWKYGWGRIQVVPSVQVAYDRKTALASARLLREKQSKLEWKNGVPPRHLDSTVRWIKDPPRTVRCHPWPEVNGLQANVWKTTEWVKPYLL